MTREEATRRVLSLFPSHRALGRRLGCSATLIRDWRKLGIHWTWHDALYAAAQEAKIRGVTRELLAQAAPRPPTPLPPLTEDNTITPARRPRPAAQPAA